MGHHFGSKFLQTCDTGRCYSSTENAERTSHADDDLQELTDARKVLVEMRQNWAKAIAAGYKREETETALERIAEVQQAIEVIDIAMEELEAEEDDE
jgi:hypothetical protein